MDEDGRVSNVESLIVSVDCEKRLLLDEDALLVLSPNPAPMPVCVVVCKRRGLERKYALYTVPI